jgi:hypothetical protein
MSVFFPSLYASQHSRAIDRELSWGMETANHKPKTGRPPKFSPEAAAVVLEYVRKGAPGDSPPVPSVSAVAHSCAGRPAE